MQNRKWYEWLLTLVYLAMIVVCIWLTMFSRQAQSTATIVVNVAMFILVGVILLTCEKNSFIPLNGIISDLDKATAKIRKDAMNSHQFLWEQYRRGRVELFTNKTLKEQYQDYQYELNRITHNDSSYYKCDIDEYINYELIDTISHRNVLNQVAGAMTGLGILGTFIGLSLGLQSFSAGTTAEITNSIAPLMDGIKVAFHTSIYGMVFSLVFNYAYKRKLDEAENTVSTFLNTYKKYVLPDTTTDGVNKLMELQQEQTAAIHSLADSIGDQLSAGLAKLLMTQFDRFDKTISDYSMLQSQNQLDALNTVVRAFISQLDKSMNGALTDLSNTIGEACVTQRDNNRQLQDIMLRTTTAAGNLRDLEKLTSSVISSLDSYAGDVRDMQDEMMRSLGELQSQNQSHLVLMDQEQKYLDDLLRYRQSLDMSANALSAQLKEQTELLADLQDTVLQMPRDIDRTFKVIDENLVDVENHFGRTIQQIKEVTQTVPDIVSGSYANMEKALDRASEAVEDMTAAMERMQRDRLPIGSRR